MTRLELLMEKVASPEDALLAIRLLSLPVRAGAGYYGYKTQEARRRLLGRTAGPAAAGAAMSPAAAAVLSALFPLPSVVVNAVRSSHTKKIALSKSARKVLKKHGFDAALAKAEGEY
jgi:hypothetical protein